MQEIIIKENEAGQRLDKLLGKYMSRAPKSFFYKMLRKKNITLNKKKAAGNEKLAVGDVVRLFLSDDTIDKFSDDSKGQILSRTDDFDEWKPDVLYEDKHVLLLNKPAGVLSQRADEKESSMVEAVLHYLLRSGQLKEEELKTFRPSVCNRLDRNTSGIIAAGKTLAGLQELSELFRSRTLKKYYLCLAAGDVTEPAHIKGTLKKDERTNKVTVAQEEDADEKGTARIETKYRPVSGNGKNTLLEVHLITGKTHQIRAHLAACGHPIIGDYKYGIWKLNDRYKREHGLSAQLLHAYRLEFPALTGALEALSGKTVYAPLPKLFTKILKEEGIAWEHGTPGDLEAQH